MLSIACASTVSAEEVRFPAPKEKTVSLAGGFGAMIDPTDESLYSAVTFFGMEEFAYPVIYDTGASGVLMSNFIRTSLKVPLTGENFEDEGIGGSEVFDVTVPTRLMLAPNSVGAGGADDLSNYQSYGEFSFQVKRQDLAGGQAPVDIIGTPVLKNYVMHVRPNVTAFQTEAPFLHYMRTDLLPEPPELPDKGVFRIPLVYKNFIKDTDPPISVNENPIVPNVRIVDDRRAPDEEAPAIDWLFDTGASTTIIGTDYAEAIGINLGTESPVNTVRVEGVGGSRRELKGYRVDELIFPMTNGDELIFEDTIVYVPELGALPADLPGIVGMNLFAPSFSEQDRTGLPTDITPTRFSDWYVDSLNGVLAIVDPNSDYGRGERLPGDFNDDDVANLLDVNLLAEEIAAGSTDVLFDVDGDGGVDQSDLELLLSGDILTDGNKLNGDANFDGRVAFADFATLSVNYGKDGKKWSEGDFVADGRIDFADFVTMSLNYNLAAASTAAGVVPEPSSGVLFVVMLLPVLTTVRRRR